MGRQPRHEFPERFTMSWREGGQRVQTGWTTPERFVGQLHIVRTTRNCASPLIIRA